MDIREITAEERSALRERMYPPARAAYLERAGSDGERLIESYEKAYAEVAGQQ